MEVLTKTILYFQVSGKVLRQILRAIIIPWAMSGCHCTKQSWQGAPDGRFQICFESHSAYSCYVPFGEPVIIQNKIKVSCEYICI